MSPKKNTSTAAMAPTWITAVNPTTASSATGMSMSPSAILRWPVEEIGRNSVNPWTTPRITAWPMSIVVGITVIMAGPGLATGLENLGAQLDAAGMGVADLVKVTFYLVGEFDTDRRREVISAWSAGH